MNDNIFTVINVRFPNRAYVVRATAKDVKKAMSKRISFYPYTDVSKINDLEMFNRRVDKKGRARTNKSSVKHVTEYDLDKKEEVVEEPKIQAKDLKRYQSLVATVDKKFATIQASSNEQQRVAEGAEIISAKKAETEDYIKNNNSTDFLKMIDVFQEIEKDLDDWLEEIKAAAVVQTENNENVETEDEMNNFAIEEPSSKSKNKSSKSK